MIVCVFLVDEAGKEYGCKLQLRQKSAEFMQIDEVFSYRKMAKFLRVQKNVADFELLEIRQIGMQRLKKSIDDTSAKKNKQQMFSPMLDIGGAQIIEYQIRSFFPKGYENADSF